MKLIILTDHQGNLQAIDAERIVFMTKRDDGTLPETFIRLDTHDGAKDFAYVTVQENICEIVRKVKVTL